MIQLFKKKKILQPTSKPVHISRTVENLGKKFTLPFGDTFILNHWENDYVYIQNVFGEPIETFINALETINKAIEHGLVVPDKINVICVCELKIEGKYSELVKIVETIKNNQ